MLPNIITTFKYYGLFVLSLSVVLSFPLPHGIESHKLGTQNTTLIASLAISDSSQVNVTGAIKHLNIQNTPQFISIQNGSSTDTFLTPLKRLEPSEFNHNQTLFHIATIRLLNRTHPSSQSRERAQDIDNGFKTERKLAKPFAVTIENEKHFGGLVTYTHELHPAQICRVMNACVRHDGTLVLPEWMQRHDNTLSFHCGQSKLEFSMPDTSPPPQLLRFDLVGLHSPRPSMPDFVRDFFPNAVVFDLVYGDHQVAKSCHSRKGHDCEAFPGLEDRLKPAVFLNHRLKTLKPKQSWVRQFVQLMKPPYSGKKPLVLYDDDVQESESTMTCFRSAMFTRGPFNKNIVMADHLQNIHFLERHGIQKAERNVRQLNITSQSETPVCNLNLTLSNRKLIDGAHNRLIGRYIKNMARLKEAVEHQARRIPGLELQISTMTLEGRSLRWQINAMQKTDIWVAGHGPLLTNMLFLRTNSTVIEIQPFAYYPKTYETMSERLAHVMYDRYIADPDVQAFRICMNQLYPAEDSAHKEAMAILEKYNQAASKFFQSDNTHSLVLHGLNDSEMSRVKTCAQLQRFDTNAKNLAIAIVRHARIRCGFPKPALGRKHVRDK